MGLFALLLAAIVILFFAYVLLWRHAYVNACKTFLLAPPEVADRFAVVLGIRPAVCAELPLRKERFASKMRAAYFERRLIPTYLFSDVRNVMKPV